MCDKHRSQFKVVGIEIHNSYLDPVTSIEWQIRKPRHIYPTNIPIKQQITDKIPLRSLEAKAKGLALWKYTKQDLLKLVRSYGTFSQQSLIGVNAIGLERDLVAPSFSQ